MLPLPQPLKQPFRRHQIFRESMMDNCQRISRRVLLSSAALSLGAATAKTFGLAILGRCSPSPMR